MGTFYALRSLIMQLFSIVSLNFAVLIIDRRNKLFISFVLGDWLSNVWLTCSLWVLHKAEFFLVIRVAVSHLSGVSQGLVWVLFYNHLWLLSFIYRKYVVLTTLACEVLLHDLWLDHSGIRAELFDRGPLFEYLNVSIVDISARGSHAHRICLLN